MQTVVIVDDYAPNLELFARVVKTAADCNVMTFVSPAEALRWIAGMETDLVVIDYAMPGMNGVEFTRELRGMPHRASVPVLLISAIDDKDAVKEAFRGGVNALLRKPVDTMEFTAQVRTLVSLSSLRREAERLNDEDGRKIAESRNAIAAQERGTLERLLAAMELRHPDTARQMRAVRDISVIIARHMHLAADDIELINDAAIAYDIGKLTFTDAIFTGSAPLTAQARALVRGHADAGAKILGGSRSRIFQAAERIARTHHERFDGAGYPAGLKGEAIPVFGRIVAVADAFVAMMHARPYRTAISAGHATDQIARESGLHFDPSVVAAFKSAQAKIIARASESLRIPATTTV
jgi:response regulator RpfG family c-di-GMP phosphodiesterase